MAWKSKGGWRVATSTIEAEAISLEGALKMAVFLSKVWREMLCEELEIVGRTDSETLERAITSNTAISNRRLKIDLAAIKKAIEDGDVREVMWISRGE